MEVFFNGEWIFDKKGEGNIYLDLVWVREMRKVIDVKFENLELVFVDD